MVDNVINNIDRVGNELIMISHDYVNQNYALLYKID